LVHNCKNFFGEDQTLTIDYRIEAALGGDCIELRSSGNQLNRPFPLLLPASNPIEPVTKYPDQVRVHIVDFCRKDSGSFETSGNRLEYILPHLGG
jgi:hypothetical protein